MRVDPLSPSSLTAPSCASSVITCAWYSVSASARPEGSQASPRGDTHAENADEIPLRIAAKDAYALSRLPDSQAFENNLTSRYDLNHDESAQP